MSVPHRTIILIVVLHASSHGTILFHALWTNSLHFVGNSASHERRAQWGGGLLMAYEQVCLLLKPFRIDRGRLWRFGLERMCRYWSLNHFRCLFSSLLQLWHNCLKRIVFEIKLKNPNTTVLKELSLKLNQKTHICYDWLSDSFLSVLPIIVIIWMSPPLTITVL